MRDLAISSEDQNIAGISKPFQDNLGIFTNNFYSKYRLRLLLRQVKIQDLPGPKEVETGKGKKRIRILCEEGLNCGNILAVAATHRAPG